MFVASRDMAWDHAAALCGSLLRRLVLERSGGPYTLIRASRRPWTVRPTAELPFRFALTAEAAAATGPLQEHVWFSGSETAGIELGAPVAVRGVKPLEAVLSSRRVDVLVALAAESARVERALEKLPLSAAPRVVVVLHDPRDVWGAPSDGLRDGVARVDARGPLASWANWLEGIAAGLAHDLPVHDAAFHAATDPHSGNVLPMGVAKIWGNPGSVHGVRLSDAIDGLVDAADDVISVVSEERTEMVPVDLGAQMMTELRTSKFDVVNDRSQAQSFMPHITSSARESQGLQPAMAWARRLAEERSALDAARRTVARVERSVDLCFRRSISPMLLDGELPADLQALRVSRTSALQTGARYRLCFRVGHPYQGSLFDVPPPSIDPLLQAIDPKPRHTVDVVLYPLDFVNEGAAVRQVAIPAFGPSPTVSFAVRTPERLGRARLRVAVFLGVHLVQSYVVHAEVAESESAGEQRAELEFSRSEDLAAVEDLPHRDLAVLLNDDGEAHSFQFKMGGATGTVRWDKSDLRPYMDAVRKRLEDMAIDSPRRFPAAGCTDPDAFVKSLADLAEQGRSLYLYLLEENEDLRPALYAIARSCDKSLQAVFCEPNAEFPWALVYDRTIDAAQVKRVCLDDSCKAAHAGGDTVCAAGFWGLRHVVEQLVAFGAKTPTYAPAGAWPAAGAVRIYKGVDDLAAERLVTDLSAKLSVSIPAEGARNPPFVDTLWSEARSAVTLVLGPVTAGENPAIRVELEPPDDLVSGRSILDRMATEQAAWKPPSSVVLLLGCRSGAPPTFALLKLHRAVLSAGAAALLVAECDVYSDVAALFGEHVVLALGLKDEHGNRLSFGEAVRCAREKLLSAGNPLALAFTAYGDASLRFT